VTHVVTLKYSPNVDMPARLTEEIENIGKWNSSLGDSTAGKIIGPLKIPLNLNFKPQYLHRSDALEHFN
jgi:hypothetical protein